MTAYNITYLVFIYQESV